jgi:membrane-associated phospholipid phosphatase
VTLGVHFVSDVLAGYVLGAAWVAAMIATFNAWRRESGHPTADPARGLEARHASRLGVSGAPGRDPSG